MEEKNFLTDSAEKISINLTDFKKLHLRFSCLPIANLTSLGSKSACNLCYQSNHLQNRLASVSEHSSGFAPILFALANAHKRSVSEAWTKAHRSLKS
ncbi:hypothetical protein [Helicobacter pylori]